MNRAILVLGPESSGTRLVTRILINAGCAGSSEHFQPIDYSYRPDRSQPDYRALLVDPLLVWRRSVPHNGQPLDLGRMKSILLGYKIDAVVVQRDMYCVVESQVKNKLATNRTVARERYDRAYRFIFEQLIAMDIPMYLLSFESLIMEPVQTQHSMLKALGLRVPDMHVRVTDENRKHWDRYSVGG